MTVARTGQLAGGAAGATFSRARPGRGAGAVGSSAINLARRPFVNVRPVRRTGLLLALLGLGLFAINSMLFWRHFTGLGDKRQQLSDLEASIGAETRSAAELEEQLGRLDTFWQNEQVTYLNERIAERAFPWSRLFDQLAELLPAEVRLLRLAPQGLQKRSEQRSSRSQPSLAGEPVTLRLDGIAKSGEALLAFVDALFAHPRFDHPSPQAETTAQEGAGEVRFTLTVDYLPGEIADSPANVEIPAPDPAAPAPAAGTKSDAGGRS